ncbi:unnamed protein product [Polarella glacialis]|uniref:Uncharacterized protein n=1 Tax=Polarella glacialis TaxID=89957 RepID=A0A813G8R3_POLGL|nr:unnamed protein product [Polarella glacialis]
MRTRIILKWAGTGEREHHNEAQTQSQDVQNKETIHDNTKRDKTTQKRRIVPAIIAPANFCSVRNQDHERDTTNQPETNQEKRSNKDKTKDDNKKSRHARTVCQGVMT